MDACGVDRDAAKELHIRLMFGGGVDSWVADHDMAPEVAMRIPSAVHDLRKELLRNATTFLAMPEQRELLSYMATRPSNPDGAVQYQVASAIAIFLQTKERECVEALIDAAFASGRTVGSIIYDGIHVEKLYEEEAVIPGEPLTTWRRHVPAVTGFDMELACKAFDQDPEWLADVGLPLVAPPAIVDACAERKAVFGIRAALCSRWPDRFDALRMDSFTATSSYDKSNSIRFSFMDAAVEIRGVVYSDYYVQVDGDAEPLVGTLAPGLLLREHAHRLHTSICRQDLSYEKDIRTSMATMRGMGGKQDVLITIEARPVSRPSMRFVWTASLCARPNR